MRQSKRGQREISHMVLLSGSFQHRPRRSANAVRWCQQLFALKSRDFRWLRLLVRQRFLCLYRFGSARKVSFTLGLVGRFVKMCYKSRKATGFLDGFRLQLRIISVSLAAFAHNLENFVTFKSIMSLLESGKSQTSIW